MASNRRVLELSSGGSRSPSTPETEGLNGLNLTGILLANRSKPPSSTTPIRPCSSRHVQLGFDIILFITLAGSLVVLMLKGSPRERGFFCNDVTISYPDTGNSLPSYVIYTAVAAVAVFTVCSIEFISQVLHSRRRHGRKVQFILSVVKVMLLLVYGNLITMVTIVSTRLIGGRLRPHFLHTCMPDGNATAVCDELQAAPAVRYISNYTCTNPDTAAVQDARMSFPSLEAAVTVYNAIVILMYLEEKRVLKFSSFLKSQVQLLIVACTIGVCTVQVSDNRHHADDVIASVAIATAAALWSVFCLTNHVRKQSVASSSNQNEGELVTEEMFEPIKNIQQTRKQMSKQNSLEERVKFSAT